MINTRNCYFIIIVFLFHACSNDVKNQDAGYGSKGKSLKILFDATKAEMCGNADWVIDADVHNLGYNNTGLMLVGKGNESNPQRLPTPDQAEINENTTEDYWSGALSGWAIDCVKEGFKVETLPNGSKISYGDTTNDQDLSKYQIYIVDEPNIKFNTIEKNAILSFIKNGGGLFIISDHDKSDRNNDKWDSPSIWNDLNIDHLLPLKFDFISTSQTSSHFAIDKHPVLDGKYGRPKQLKISAGSQMSISDGADALCVSKQSKDKNNGVLVAVCSLGLGRVIAISDSSPMDDGSGDAHDKLYNGYFKDVNGDHRKLLMNAILWLANNKN